MRTPSTRSRRVRGNDQQTDHLFSYISPEQRVPSDHPLRPIRQMVDAALSGLSPAFEELYSWTGRPSIPPEQLLRALLLQILFSIRSERMLMEQLEYNLLFRWFVGLSMDDDVWVPTVFTKNRDRLLAGDIANRFFAEVKAEAQRRGLLSDDHFTVDGTLLEAWASFKSFKSRDGKDAPAPPDDPGNPTVDFHGEKRSNATHQSTTAPDARLYKKGKGRPAQLAYLGHVLMENRHGLVIDTEVTPADGYGERDAALRMAERIPGTRRATLGADKAYDMRDVVEGLRAMAVTPHVAQYPETKHRGSAIDGRTTGQPGYAVSQKIRKRVEEIFGWMKTVGLLRELRHRGGPRVGWVFTFTAAVYNLIRIRNLAEAAA
jgi:transposase